LAQEPIEFVGAIHRQILIIADAPHLDLDLQDLAIFSSSLEHFLSFIGGPIKQFSGFRVSCLHFSYSQLSKVDGRKKSRIARLAGSLIVEKQQLVVNGNKGREIGNLPFQLLDGKNSLLKQAHTFRIGHRQPPIL